MAPRGRQPATNPSTQPAQETTAAGTSSNPLPTAAANPPDRIDQLQRQVETLTAVVEKMATALAGLDHGRNAMPPLEDAPTVPVNAAEGNQGIGDQHGDTEEIGDSRANEAHPARSNRSVGSRRRAARRRARERAAAPLVDNRGTLPRPPQDART